MSKSAYHAHMVMLNSKIMPLNDYSASMPYSVGSGFTCSRAKLLPPRAMPNCNWEDLKVVISTKVYMLFIISIQLDI